MIIPAVLCEFDGLLINHTPSHTPKVEKAYRRKHKL